MNLEKRWLGPKTSDCLPRWTRCICKRHLLVGWMRLEDINMANTSDIPIRLLKSSTISWELTWRESVMVYRKQTDFPPDGATFSTRTTYPPLPYLRMDMISKKTREKSLSKARRWWLEDKRRFPNFLRFETQQSSHATNVTVGLSRSIVISNIFVLFSNILLHVLTDRRQQHYMVCLPSIIITQKRQQ